MREILFRGKQLNGSEWFEGDLSSIVQNGGRCFVFPADGYNSPDWYEVDPSTVGQYTGLTDKNGKKIFEGDIIFRTWLGGTKIYKVCYEQSIATFIGKCVNDSGFTTFDSDGDMFEVMGNIHDNPELIEG